jgi:hypothetical protein
MIFHTSLSMYITLQWKFVLTIFLMGTLPRTLLKRELRALGCPLIFLIVNYNEMELLQFLNLYHLLSSCYIHG